MTRRSCSRGFTLVEVLVAMMIMAILAMMAWQGVDGIVRARNASQSRLEQTLRLNTVIAQWEQDLASLQESSAVPGLVFNGASLRLTRRADNGLQVVVWALYPAADGGTGGGEWLRWAGPAVTSSTELQDSWLRSQQFQGKEPGQVRTLTGVAQWQMYCFQGNAWSNCQSTGNIAAPTPGASAPAAPRQALPSGVRLVLSFAEGSGLNGSLTRDIAVGP